MTSPTPFSYTGRDYLSLRDQVVAYLKSRMPQWSADPSDPVTVIAEAMAGMGDILSYYVDVAAQESNILSANSPSNVYAHAELFGYTPSSALSAGVWLDLAHVVPKSSKVVVPKGQAAMDPSTGLLFEIDNEVSLVPGQSATVFARQGVSRKLEVGTATGYPGQRITVPVPAGEYIDGRDGTMSVTMLVVSGGHVQLSDTWTPTEALIDAGGDDRVFTLVVDAAGNAALQFGDGEAGALPPKGATIVFNHRVCAGERANAVLPRAVKVWATPYTADSDVRAVAVSNPDQPTGGVDVESVESVRTQAVKFARSQRRAVTSEDYSRVIRTIGDVQDATTSAHVWSQPRIWALPRDRSLITDNDPRHLELKTDFLNRVLHEARSLSMLGTTPTAHIARVAELSVEVEVHAWPAADIRTLAEDVYAAVADGYGYDDARFDREITEDHILRTINQSVSPAAVRFARVLSVEADDHTLVQSPGKPLDDGDLTDFSGIVGLAPIDGTVLVVGRVTVIVRATGKKHVYTGSK